MAKDKKPCKAAPDVWAAEVIKILDPEIRKIVEDQVQRSAFKAVREALIHFAQRP